MQGGISKVWYPDENRLERIPNVSNYEIYIERIEEMIQRKKTVFSPALRRKDSDEDIQEDSYGGELNSAHIGQEVVLNGWIQRRRNLGGLIFCDLRDKPDRSDCI